MYSNLNDQQQFRLNKISEVKEYFIAETRERELTRKRLSKYISSFEYFDQSFIALSGTSCSISIALFVTAITVTIASSSFSFAVSITTGIVKKLLETTQSKKKKHNNIVMLAKSKLNRIESKISEALINNKTTHEDFATTINEEKNIGNLKKALE